MSSAGRVRARQSGRVAMKVAARRALVGPAEGRLSTLSWTLTLALSSLALFLKSLRLLPPAAETSPVWLSTRLQPGPLSVPRALLACDCHDEIGVPFYSFSLFFLPFCACRVRTAEGAAWSVSHTQDTTTGRRTRLTVPAQELATRRLGDRLDELDLGEVLVLDLVVRDKLLDRGDEVRLGFRAAGLDARGGRRRHDDVRWRGERRHVRCGCGCREGRGDKVDAPLGTSPLRSSGTPMTHTSWTSSCARRWPSSSAGATWKPEHLMSSLMRSVMVSIPDSVRKASSPVWRKPSLSNVSAVALSLLRSAHVLCQFRS